MHSGEEARTQAEAALRRGALVVAAHEHAAAALRRHFDRTQHAAGHRVWEAPAVRSWSAWRHDLWRAMLLSGQEERLLLSAEQELALWRAIIEADPAPREQVAVERLAGAARVAWLRLCAFAGQRYLRTGQSAGWTLPGEATTEDTLAFARWAAELRRRCHDRALLSEAELNDALSLALDAGKLQPAAGELLLLGFTDERTPSERRLLEAVRRAGVQIDELAGGPRSTARIQPADTEEAELRACARWCREQLAHTRRSAVLLADQTRLQALQRLLRATLPPSSPSSAAGSAAVVASSLAGTAAQQPMIAAALDLLRLATGALPLERASALLRSRYLASGVDPPPDGTALTAPLLWSTEEFVDTPEWAARAQFDAFELRAQVRLRPELTVGTLAREVSRSRRRGRLPILRRALEGLRHESEALPEGRRSFGFWAEKMRTLLIAAGWRTRREGELAAEAQTERLWESLLDTLATLDFAAPRVSLIEALARLHRIADRRLVRPPRGNAPIEILRPGELVAGEFDAVWCLGAGEATWPSPSASTPLLPWRLQQQLGMPGADRRRDEERAIASWATLAASALEVVFSYPQQAAGGIQRAAPTLRALNLSEAPLGISALDDPTRDGPPLPPALLIAVRDTVTQPALPDGVLRGGARVLEAQAACAFRAFAEHRLWSTAIDGAELGLDAGERGSLVHRALEQIWKRLEGSQQLLAMSLAERRRVIDEAVARALPRSSASGDTAWESAYLSLERDRLARLLERWLEVEAARPPFQVHLQERALDDVAIGPLRLSVRIDRVDLVAGRRVLIDYKTGKASSQSWRGERPDAPQLPLYAILTETPQEADTGALGAVAFAAVHAGSDARLRGFAESTDLLPNTDTRMDAPTFEQQVARWRAVLETLAIDFASGAAAVLPKKYPSTCARCRQRTVCRLDPSSLDETAEDGDERLEVERG